MDLRLLETKRLGVNSNGTTIRRLAVERRRDAGLRYSVTYHRAVPALQRIGGSHSLGVAPKMFIIKPRTGSFGWAVYHDSIGNTKYLTLNTTNAAITNSTLWNNTSPTSTDFTLGSGHAGTGTQIVYLFAEVAGFSKFGSYTGNGSADGPFVFCGFRPRFVLVKQSSSSGNNWVIYDTARDTYNECDSILYPNLS
jgi:hypothetical protein